MKSELSDVECRACFHKTESSLSFTELQKLSKIYTELTSIKIGLDDEHFPVAFCDLCRSRLFEFEAFKQLCQHTYELFCVRRNDVKLQVPAFEVCLVKLEVDEVEPNPYTLDESVQTKPDKLFICDVCDKKFLSRKTLKTHLRGQHFKALPVSIKAKKKKLLKCPKDGCEKKFSDEDRLEAHLRVHDGKKPELCSVCGMGLSTQRALRKHLETHNTERNQKCSYCEKAFKTKTQLDVHERYIHRKERAFVCNQCGAVFYNPTGLCAHVKSKHTEERKYQCDECPRAFKHSFHLRDHKVRHTRTREFLCSKCDKTFVTNLDLKRHERENHSSIDRSAECEVCSRILKDKKSLKMHMFTHTGEKPFKCNLCTSGFTVKTALERHMTTHTGIKKFKCTLCEKSYAEKFYLKKHFARNHAGILNTAIEEEQDRRYLPKC